MVKTSTIPAATPRGAFFALLMIAMFAAVFHIGGNEAHAGSASLAWSAPATNTDGTPVSNLAGYKIHIGTASRSYQQHIDVGNRTDYTVSNLADGATHYFAVTAYNSAGAESPYSTEATKAFPAVTVTHSINAYAGTGGSITAQNNTRTSSATSGATTITSVTVNHGASQTFSITPAAGMRIADVTVNGKSIGAVTSYTFSNLTYNQWMSARFTAATTTTHTVNAYAGAGGSITPQNNSRVTTSTSGTTTTTSVTVPHAASQSFTITPAAGYQIADVKVNGTSIGAVTSYTFSNLTYNQWMSATFKAATATATAGKVVFAASSGGTQYTDASGVVYQADLNYSGGRVATVSEAIANTSDDPLYQSERWGASSYSIPLPNGNYNLTLKFAENYWSAAGQRVFDVAVNGTTMVSNLDVFAKAGRNAAYDVVLPVTVANGTLKVDFLNKIDNAKICAIKVATR